MYLKTVHRQVRRKIKLAISWYLWNPHYQHTNIPSPIYFSISLKFMLAMPQNVEDQLSALELSRSRFQTTSNMHQLCELGQMLSYSLERKCPPQRPMHRGPGPQGSRVQGCTLGVDWIRKTLTLSMEQSKGELIVKGDMRRWSLAGGRRSLQGVAEGHLLCPRPLSGSLLVLCSMMAAAFLPCAIPL